MGEETSSGAPTASDLPGPGPGEAAIKAEFLVTVVRPPRLAPASDAASSAEVAEAASADGVTKKARLDDGGDRWEAVSDKPSDSHRPDEWKLHKKEKQKGMNKHRAGPQRTPPGQKLCPWLKDVTEGEPEGRCNFQGKRGACHFLHDTAEYLASKPADLGDTCYMFTEHGRCPSGLTCRFGATHTTSSHRNRLGDPARWQAYQHSRPTRNHLEKPFQHQLWKRKYDFSRANAAVNIYDRRPERERERGRGRGGGRGRGRGVNGTARVPDDGADAAAFTSSGGVLEAADVATAPPHETAAAPPDQQEAVSEEVSAAAAEKAEAAPSVEAEMAPSEGRGQPMEVETGGQTTSAGSETPLGPVSDTDLVRIRPPEKKQVRWEGQLYLAPLTTVGNLPFRRLCRRLGADVTCGEMAMASNLLQASQAEWALVRRHHTESVFGAQICGNNPGVLTRCAQLLNEKCELDFIDINMGCPIDMVFEQGSGSALMRKRSLLENACRSISSVIDIPLTLKMRTGVHRGVNLAKPLLAAAHDWGVDMATLHGRSREQRYTKLADWSYVAECARAAAPLPLFGNGDVLSWEEYEAKKAASGVAGIMLARGALIKPWIFTEIKEKRTWDISSSERLDLLKEYANYGLEHWGSDTEGVGKTRRFLLEWLSFLHRYIPAGVLVAPPQRINERPPAFRGRDHLETLMASSNCRDWVTISEMVLGKVPDDFEFVPKHKANSYS